MGELHIFRTSFTHLLDCRGDSLQEIPTNSSDFVPYQLFLGTCILLLSRGWHSRFRLPTCQKHCELPKCAAWLCGWIGSLFDVLPAQDHEAWVPLACRGDLKAKK